MKDLGIRALLLPLAGAVIIAAIVATAWVRDTTSDANLLLLVSQSIIDNGTLKLDSYADDEDIGLVHIRKLNGHDYYYFPIGTSLAAVPAVWVFKVAGWDMRYDRKSAQIIIITLLVPVIFLLIYKTGRYFLPPALSFAISLAAFLGSSLTSTLGTAFWTHDLTALIIALCVLFVVRHNLQGRALNPYLFGFLLFAAYLNRPISAMFIAAVCVYFVLKKEYALLVKSLAVVAGLFFIFIAFSLYEFGQWLPEYYQPGRLKSDTFWLALYGLLLSPSRGVLVFSPFLLVGIGLLISEFRVHIKDPLVLFSASCVVFYLLTIAKFPDWYGGASFGPRYQSDFFPVYILLLFIAVRRLIENKSIRRRASACALLALTGAAAIWINSYEGMYNPWTAVWNHQPRVHANPGKFLFDWRNPQFLANGQNIRERLLDHEGRDRIEVYVVEEEYGLIIIPRVTNK